MEFVACVLIYVLGSASVICGFYISQKMKKDVHIRVEPEKIDDKEERINQQWQNMLNYDGDAKE